MRKYSIYRSIFKWSRKRIIVTLTGNYIIDNNENNYEKSCCLSAVKRFNHKDGIVPYNEILAMIQNSSVFVNDELNLKDIIEV